MKRLIVARSNWTWQWRLPYFPKAGEKIAIPTTTATETHPLADAITPLEGVEDCRICLPKPEFPEEITIQSPGEIKPTRFHLTGERRDSYTIDEDYAVVVTDAPVVLKPSGQPLIVELGWQCESQRGLRVVTAELAKIKFGSSPEAFSAGTILGATAEHPVLYILGGGAAVWLIGGQSGSYWQDPIFTDPWQTLAATATAISTALVEQQIGEIHQMLEQWHEHRTSQK